MLNEERKKIVVMLKEILSVEDTEIKNCAIESLIEMLQDRTNKGLYEDSERTRS